LNDWLIRVNHNWGIGNHPPATGYPPHQLRPGCGFYIVVPILVVSDP